MRHSGVARAGSPEACSGHHGPISGWTGLDRQREIWAMVRPRLRAELGGDDYRAWIAPLAVCAAPDRAAAATDTGVWLSAPNPYARNRVRANFLRRIEAVWAQMDPAAPRLSIILETEAGTEMRADGSAAPSAAAPVIAGDGGGGSGDGETGGAVVAAMTARTFGSFVVGASNEVAFAVAKRLASEPGAGGDLALFYGGFGVGKTHLIEAIGNHVAALNAAAGRDVRRVVMLTAQQFLNAFQAALREGDTGPFKAALRAADLLLLDDLHLICGKTATQDEFFQTLGDLVASGKSVVCTANCGPEEIGGLTDRMRDVLSGGYSVQIGEPDQALKTAIAAAKVAEMAAKRPDFAVCDAALEIIAASVSGGGRAVEGAVKKVFAASALVGREATMDVVVETLAGGLPPVQRAVPVDQIKRRVAAHFDLSLDDLISQRRHRAVARPRQIAMYFCKKLTKRSFPDIGQRFGGRDHTTVMHAVKRIEDLAGTDPAFQAELQQIGRKIVG